MSRRDAVYARQSVEKKDSLSLSGQLDLCRRAAGERELAVYQDAGYSGKNTDRPAFQKLMRDVQAGQIAAIYVYRLDRFSRSVADFGQLWQVLQAHQVEFVSVSENFDTSTPMGRAMLHIIMVFAQLERETIAQRVRDNYYRRAALGAWPGGPAPFGFSNGRAVGRDGRLAPALVPDENAALVRRIFAEYAAEGMSLSGLAKKLTGEGIPAPRRAVWDSVTLSRLLHNPAYVMADEQVRLHYLAQGVKISDPPEYFDGRCGLLLVGKREAAGRSRTDAEAQTLSVLGSLGLVEAPLFLRCQEKLQKNRQLGRSGQGRYTWLSGLLKCACCGYGISVLNISSPIKMSVVGILYGGYSFRYQSDFARKTFLCTRRVPQNQVSHSYQYLLATEEQPCFSIGYMNIILQKAQKSIVCCLSGAVPFGSAPLFLFQGGNNHVRVSIRIKTNRGLPTLPDLPAIYRAADEG